ncbi:4'-phosphopantetheinyl transferase superfamily protein [Flavobacterium sp. LBUM151]
MIYIYYSYLSAENHENVLKKELPELPFDFKEKIKKHRKWQDIQLSVLGRFLLFYGMEKNFDLNRKNLEIQYNQYHKPFFEGNQVYFNISHAAEIVICAITNVAAIGIDIEKIKDIEIDNFKINMTDAEWIKIAFSENKMETFFDYWTQKEAVLKAIGKGQSINLKSFEIIENKTIVDNEKFYLKEMSIDEKYKCYIASKNILNAFYIERITYQK